MKKIVIILLALTLLSSCTSSKTSSSNISAIIENSSSKKTYSFSEVDVLFGLGSFSVNDLVKVFGEPSFIDGYRWDGGAFAVNVQFNDIVFDLVANKGEELNFIVKDDLATSGSYGRYTVTESDKSVRMKPLNSCIIGKNWPLPRNIKIGDSRNKLTNAYNGDKGKKEILGGELTIFYDYGQSGNIAYVFSISKPTVLDRVEIMWYDSNILGPAPTNSDTSFPPTPLT